MTNTKIIIVSTGDQQEFFTDKSKANRRYDDLMAAGIPVTMLEGSVRITQKFDPYR